MPALQSLRGLAALWVVLYHVQVYLRYYNLDLLPIPGLRLGWLGVDLFFVLSAYLLGQPFLDGRPPRYRRFIADRFLRVAPPYYAAFAFAALAYAAFAPEAWIPSKAWWSLVFLQNFRKQTFIAANPAFWSLAVELQFYLLLPWMARLFRGRRWPWALAGALLASYLWRALLYRVGTEDALQWETFTLPGFLGHFALGLAAGRLRRIGAPIRPGVRRATFAGGLALVALPAWLWIPAGSIYFSVLSLAGDTLVRPVAACGFALVVLATASGGWVTRALSWKPLEWLGAISYSLYLIHVPAEILALKAVPPVQDPLAWSLVAVLGSLLAGWLLYRGVEAPAEVWRRRRKLRQRAAANAARAAVSPPPP
jgi:peptidoglycan/LPS O-acetylase OafA/YrhL